MLNLKTKDTASEIVLTIANDPGNGDVVVSAGFLGALVRFLPNGKVVRCVLTPEAFAAGFIPDSNGRIDNGA